MRYYSTIIIAIFFLSSCSKGNNDFTLFFVGDSMVANWDVEASFPNRETRNWGKDGARVDYLNDVNLLDNEVIMLIGTNDLRANMNGEQIQKYAEKYQNAVSAVSTGRIILLSVLPTGNADKNETIKTFNTIIEQWASLEPNIKYLNCYSKFLDENDLLKSDLTREGLHLNDYGYIILTDIVQSTL